MKQFLKKIQSNPFISEFMRSYQSAETDITSIAVAYYFLISIFPLLLIVTNILPYFQISADSFLGTLGQVLPDSLYQPVVRMTRSILSQPSTGLLSVSILSALWTFSQTMTYLQKAFNKVYGVEQGRGLIWARVFSFMVSLGLQIFLGLSLLLATFGRMLVRVVFDIWDLNPGTYASLLDLTEPLVYVLLFVSLGLIYYVLPNVRIGKIRYILPGTSFVILVLYSISNIFSSYIENYMERFLDARFLGSVLILVIMFWFILIAKILIWGAILNASYQACYDQTFQTRNGEIKKFVKEELKKGG